jgi:CBS-domain-containing membrane protein
MNLNDNDRDEFRALDREPADRPTRRELAADRCPDIMGRDIVPTFDPETDPF